MELIYEKDMKFITCHTLTRFVLLTTRKRKIPLFIFLFNCHIKVARESAFFSNVSSITLSLIVIIWKYEKKLTFYYY